MSAPARRCRRRPHLLNGRRAPSYLLDAFHDWLRTLTEGIYHSAHKGGYIGSDPAKTYRRWQKWDGRLD